MKHYIDCSKKPYIPNGWTVEEHRKGPKKFVWDASKVSLYLSEKQKSGLIKGNELRKELANKPVLNANVLDYLLAHPELIPEEWKGKYIFFWGTIYLGSDGFLRVRCLSWGDDRWYWVGHWLEDGWDDDYPTAVSAGAPQTLEPLDLSGEVIELKGTKYKLTKI